MEYLQPHYASIGVPIYCTKQSGRWVLAIPHFHEGIEIIRVNTGEVECSIGKKNYICTKGDIVFVPPYSVHSVLSVSDDAEIQGAVFDISAVIGPNAYAPIDLILNKDRIKMPFHRLGSELNDRINALLREILDRYQISNIQCELEMRAILCKLTAELVGFYYASFDEIREIGRLQPVIGYIRENYKYSIRTSDLSKLLNVCNDHLIRLFNGTMGITPTKYINNVRLEEMQKMLVHSDASITEISYMVGFSSVNYMSKVFKEAFGLTPSQYRKRSITK